MIEYFKKTYYNIWIDAFLRAPEECCGIILNDEYHPCANVAEDKINNFRISSKQMVKAYKSGALKAVVHSHVDYPHLSADDIQKQRKMNIPWGVALINNNYKEGIHFWGCRIAQTLTERPFIHGLYVCYSLVSDYFKQHFRMDLPFAERDIDWEKKGNNLFEKKFIGSGFAEVKNKELVVGDIILFKFKSKEWNHCAVYIGKETMLHHLYKRFSASTSIYPWINKADAVVRYQGELVKC